MPGRREPAPAMPNRRFRLFALGLVRIFVRLFFRLDYEGLQYLPPSGPAIIVSNHTSMADMLAIQSPMTPWVSWVAKKELFGNPLFKAVFTRLGCIPVDRDKSDVQAARDIFTALRNKQIIGMFPQGTRVKPECIPFVRPRSGAVHFAIKTGTPILPVAIDGRFRLFGRVRVVYGAPFRMEQDPHSNLTLDDMHRLANDVMRRVYALIDYDYQPVIESREPQA